MIDSPRLKKHSIAETYFEGFLMKSFDVNWRKMGTVAVDQQRHEVAFAMQEIEVMRLRDLTEKMKKTRKMNSRIVG